MAKIAEALGLPVAYFHAVDNVLAEVILLVSRMPPAEREAILALIRERVSTPE
ncbi:hypothetical protein ACSYS7_004116 [Stenotrophomonas maltophilia]